MPTRHEWRRPRLVAVLIGLSPFLLLELILQVVGYGSHSFDTFVPDQPFFVQEGGLVLPAPGRRSYFQPKPFTAEKAAGTTRIAVVGDSVTFGFTHVCNRDEDGNPILLPRPYPVLLQESLSARFPGERVEVLNCGACGCASFRLKDLTREVVQFSPDLVIYLAGTSEMLESRLFKDWEQVREKVGFLSQVKTLTLARRLLRTVRMETGAGREVVTYDSPFLPVLDEDIVRGPHEIDALLDHSAHNLREVCGICEEAEVPLVLCTVPANLRVPPTAMLHRMPKAKELVLQDMPRERTARFEEEFSGAEVLIDTGHCREALKKLEAARQDFADDPRIAEYFYLTARACEGLGNWPEARRFFMLAKDRDPCVFRVLGRFNEIVRTLAGEDGVHLVDLELSFEEAVPDGIPDYRLFFDFSHPREAGHQIIAREIEDVLVAAHLVGN